MDQEDSDHLEEEEFVDSGEESDLENDDEASFQENLLYPSARLQRSVEPASGLPSTVEILTADDGCRVYLVGTAHFSESSQEDVAKTIQITQPDVVMVELCKSRINILSLDEETLLREAKNINLEKIRTAIKQSGLVQGVLHLLLLSMSAHITKQLGMAPGGEFRTAFRELLSNEDTDCDFISKNSFACSITISDYNLYANLPFYWYNKARKIQGCRVHLGDRPIGITLQRALGSLSWYQKLRLAWYMITSKEPVSKEEVERCKQKDLLEEMLREMTGEFPALSRVFVTERDLYLTNSLRLSAQPVDDPRSQTGRVPSVVVGVVGIGHTPGILANWDKKIDNIHELLVVPGASKTGICVKWLVRGGVIGLVAWGCFKAFSLSTKLVLLLPSR